jgi:hypothetical protein
MEFVSLSFLFGANDNQLTLISPIEHPSNIKHTTDNKVVSRANQSRINEILVGDIPITDNMIPLMINKNHLFVPDKTFSHKPTFPTSGHCVPFLMVWSMLEKSSQGRTRTDYRHKIQSGLSP